MNSFKTDALAAFIIGILASLFSLPVIINLNIKLAFYIPFLILTPLCIIGILVARVLAPKIPLLYQFGKFGETGGLNWLMDIGILNFLMIVSGITTGLFYALFKAVSFILSAGNSYAWNKFWVFAHKKHEGAQEIGKFIMVTLVGLFINVILATMIVFFGPRVFNNISSAMWGNFGAIAGSLCAMLWNFIGYKLWVFKDK